LRHGIRDAEDELAWLACDERKIRCASLQGVRDRTSARRLKAFEANRWHRRRDRTLVLAAIAILSGVILTVCTGRAEFLFSLAAFAAWSVRASSGTGHDGTMGTGECLSISRRLPR
jgi:hypothetical protein